MTEIDFESKRDEMERDNLLGAIAALETAIAVSSPGTRAILLNSLECAKGRVQVLEKKIKDAEVERERRAEEKAAISSLAAEEVKLSQEEKETYSGFLKEDFFTKRDFARLGEFYAHTWDRLSERGKDEMSHRIWEGVRRDEYTFSELPKVVQEDEAKRVYKQMRANSAEAASTAQIPENDRADFIHAYEAGKTEEATKVLDRNSFRENMFRRPEAATKLHSAVEKGREADGIEVEKANARTATRAVQPEEPESKTDLDLSALNFGDIRIAEASSADRPNAGAARASRGALLGSS